MSSTSRQERLLITRGLWYGHEENMSSLQGYPSAEPPGGQANRVQDDWPHPPSTSKPKSRSGSAKRPMTREATSDPSLAYPQPRRDTGSPDITANRDERTPPPVGPKTPRKSVSYNNVTTLDGYETPHDRPSQMVTRTEGMASDLRRQSLYDGGSTLDGYRTPPNENNQPMSRTEGVAGNMKRRSLSDIRGSDAADVPAIVSRVDWGPSREPSRNEAQPQSLSRQSSPTRNGNSGSHQNNTQSISAMKTDAPGSRNLNTNTRQSNNITSNLHSRATRTSQKRPPANPSRHSSKKGRNFMSRLSALSRGSAYFHSEFLDDNLLISATKLDSTLLRLFGQAKDAKKAHDKDSQDPGTALMPFLNYSQSDLISMDPVLWRVYPMDAAHRETLEQEMPYIEDNIQPRDIVKNLYQDDVLTHMDYNQLTRTEGQGERAVTRLMLKTLQRRGEKAYLAFVNALSTHQYTNVCERLATTERLLREGMHEDRRDFDRRVEMENLTQSRLALGTTTPLRNSSYQGMNGIASSSANQTLLPNYSVTPGHRSSVSRPIIIRTLDPDSPPSNEKANPDDRDDPDQPIIDSEQLEKYLRDLKAELEALHDDVTALKSTRSPSTGGRNSQRVSSDSAPPVDVGEAEDQGTTQPYNNDANATGTEGEDITTESNDENRELEEIYPTDTNANQKGDPRVRTPKSGTCAIF